MASSDDFRQLLKAGNLTEALALAFSEAVDLTITTWVATANDVDTGQAKSGHRLRTRINLIEGDIENEIGDQFLGTGPYRELRQFHLEQVAQGNTIIQNNLKSLQTLFEVLITSRYSTTTPLVRENQFPDDIEHQLLPPTQKVTDAGVAVVPPEAADAQADSTTQIDFEHLTDLEVGRVAPEVVVEQAISPPDRVVSSLTDPSLVISPAVLGAEVAVSPPTPVIEEESAPPQPLEPLEPLSPESANGLDWETDEDEDDWDDSVLELLESLPADLSPDQDASDSEMDDDWGSFDEDFEPETLDSSSPQNQDWGILTLEDFEPPPVLEEPKSRESEFPDDDWGEWVEPSEPEPNQPVPQETVLNLDEDDDWDDWGEDESEAFPDAPVSDRSMVDLGDEEDWGDIVDSVDPFATAVPLHPSSSDIAATEEDWDEFSAEELEPLSILEEDPAQNSEWDAPDFLDEDELSQNESVLDQASHPNLSEKSTPESSTAQNPLEALDQFPKMPATESKEELRDPMNVWLGEQSPTIQVDADRQTDDAIDNLDEDWGDLEWDVLSPESDMAASEDEWDTNVSSADKQMPPPPPPSPFPNRNH